MERAIIHSIPKPIAVIVCYPSNPTAYVADLDFYKDLIPFAKKHGVLVLSDLAYSEVYFDNNPPPSMLQVPGATDVAVEFTSCPRPIPCRAGALVSPSATSGSSPRSVG